jgi:hypothetical protein
MSKTLGLIKIYPPECDKQKQDREILYSLIDDLGAAALALHTSGAQGYTQFIEVRERFKTSVLEISKNYRYVDAE